MAEGGEDSEHITLKVTAQDGSDVFFKIRRNTPLRKLKNAYAQRQGTDTANTRFMYNGQRIRDEDTPNDLDMENEDVIDAMVEQTGGAY